MIQYFRLCVVQIGLLVWANWCSMILHQSVQFCCLGLEMTRANYDNFQFRVVYSFNKLAITDGDQASAYPNSPCCISVVWKRKGHHGYLAVPYIVHMLSGLSAHLSFMPVHAGFR